jgi:hypothetical protein
VKLWTVVNPRQGPPDRIDVVDLRETSASSASGIAATRLLKPLDD